ncbi:cellulose binding domain-containing protein [Microbispora sp. ZYX-F-249]|uniref:Cellulose binding domain-containing protein n=1 Tax=Microbispora maris TaxID=3144104 RepID=A0ABV0AZU1_9ACTN
MRSKTALSAWMTAGLLAAAAFVVPAVVESGAGGTAYALTTAPPPPTPIPCEPSTSPSGTPPTAPGTPRIGSVLLNSVGLSWTPATDEDGIACYRVMETRDGVTSGVATFGPDATGGVFSLRWPPSGVAFEDHELYLVAIDKEGAVSPASGSVTVRIYNDIIASPSPSPSPLRITCRVDYRPITWPGGMTATVEVTNTKSTPVRDWRLTFLFTDPGQTVSTGWSATWSQTGREVTAAAPSWSTDIAAGQTVHLGFNGSPSEGGAVQWRLNGEPCTLRVLTS